MGCGAELDISEPERNPLFAAIYGGHKLIDDILLSRGVDVFCQLQQAVYTEYGC